MTFLDIIVINMTQYTKRAAPVFPKNRQVLVNLGENILLACKRRGYTQSLIAQRTGLSRLTVRRIQQGEPTVSLGHYVAVLSVLGLVDDLARVANDDVLGRKLQDIRALTAADQQSGHNSSAG